MSDREIFASEGDILICKVCKKDVYRMRKTAYRDDEVSSIALEYWDGRPVKTGDPIACPHCGATMPPPEPAEEFCRRINLKMHKGIELPDPSGKFSDVFGVKEAVS